MTTERQMKIRVLEHLEQKRQQLATHPFLAWVQDQSIEPVKRLGFAPCLAPMTMGFSDLMVLGLRDSSSTDEVQRILNQHTYVDDQHWQYLLHDLKALEMTWPMDLPSALKLLWGPHCAGTRHLTYTFMGLVRGASPIMRLVILEAIEVAADVGFRLLRLVGREYTQQTGKQLIYFGQPHQDQEDGHEAMGATSIRSMIAAHTWTADQEQQAIAYVDELFTRFRGMVDELHAYALKAREGGPFWPLTATAPTPG